MHIAIITGASSGMGKEFVKQLDKLTEINEIWIIARRGQLLKQTAKSCKKKVMIIEADLSKEEGIDKIKKALSEYRPDIKYLVNSAGYGIRKNFDEGTYNEMTGMIDTNCKALTAVTYICLPYMKKDSYIIQMASSAGFLAQAGFNVYSATKAYVISFSKALKKELRKKGINVTAVCPGPVATDFFKISDEGGKIPAYKRFFMAQPANVVKKALKDAKKKKALSIYGFSIKMLKLITRFMK